MHSDFAYMHVSGVGTIGGLDYWTGLLDWIMDYWTRRNRSQTRSQTEITLVCVN